MAAVLPDAFRQAMKQSLENARRGFETLMTANEAASNAQAMFLPPQSGVATLVREMARMTRSNVDANFSAAQRLVDVENAEQVQRVYIEYMQEGMTALSRQMQEIGSLTTQTVKAEGGDSIDPAGSITDSEPSVMAAPSSGIEPRAAAPTQHPQVARTPKRDRKPAPTQERQAKPSMPSNAANLAKKKPKARVAATRVSEKNKTSGKAGPKGGARRSSRKKTKRV